MSTPRYSPRLARLGLGSVVFAGAACAGLAPASDGDLWWHLAAGREMVARGALLCNDPFSVSAAGRPWADVHWLFQLAVYGVHQAFGLAGIVIVKCLLVGAAALIAYGALGRRSADRSRALFAVLLVGSLIAARHLLLVRPVIVSLLFLSIYFARLERFRSEGLARALLPLPLLQVLWANVQGLSALGPAVIGAYALGAAAWTIGARGPRYPFAPESTKLVPKEQLGWLVLATGLCVIGSCATPFGMRAITLPVELLARILPSHGNPFASIAENVPPFLVERSGGQFWHLKWFIGLLAVSFALAGRGARASHWVLAAGFTALALVANRNVLLLYWIGSPIAALNAAPFVRRALLSMRRYRAPVTMRWVGRVAMASLLLLAGTAAAREPTFAEPAPFHLPVASVQRIDAGGGEGAIFAADHQGGYLIWSLFPRFRPYMDTRLVLRSPEEYEAYLGIAEQPERFDDLHDRLGFRYALLPVAYPDRYASLIAHLYASAKWRLVFTDGTETLFAARSESEDDGWDLGSPATTDRILGDVGKRFAGQPRLLDAARLQLATLDIVVGEVREADRVLAELHTAEGQALRARAKLAASDLEAANEIGQKLLSADANDVRTLDLLALVHAKRGELGQATNFLKRALAIDPYDDEATNLLTQLGGPQ